MAKQYLTDATKGPKRRIITIVALAAAVLAIIMTVAMVIVALTGMSFDVLRTCFVVWVLSLFVVFGATQVLKVKEE